MPPKKQKVKVSKTSKSAGKGVKINIVIDQSKKTKGGAPKAPVGRRALPAYSAMPQGPSYLGAHYPNVQPNTFQQTTYSIPEVGKEVFNHLMLEARKRENSARGFGGFQTAGAQANQLFEGEYRAGRNYQPIIYLPESAETTAVEREVFDDPEHNQIIGDKLINRGSRLPNTNENSIIELNAEDRRDNALDNLVLHEKKGKMEAQVNRTLDEDLLEEEGNEDVAFSEIGNPTEQAQRAKELILESDESQYQGRNVTAKMKKKIYDIYSLPPIPPPKKATLSELKSYITFLNDSFGTSYETNFSGRRAVDDLRRVIRIALLKEYDDLIS